MIKLSPIILIDILVFTIYVNINLWVSITVTQTVNVGGLTPI